MKITHEKFVITLWIAAAITLVVVLTGCPLVEIKIDQMSVMDKGNDKTDTYTERGEKMIDKEVINVDAELIK